MSQNTNGDNVHIFMRERISHITKEIAVRERGGQMSMGYIDAGST